MPRSRLTEMPQRQSPRGPPPLRTSNSDSDPLHHRSRTDRSPKLADGRSPRAAQSEPLNQKKLGTRISELESQLGQARDELKCLKNHLSSAESVKKTAQEKFDKKPRKKEIVPEKVDFEEKHSNLIEMQNDSSILNETSDDVEQETDVFEVSLEKVTMEQPKTEVNLSSTDQVELEPKSISISTESPSVSELENPSIHELGFKNDDINLLKTKLHENEKELDSFHQENESLKNQLNEKSLKLSSAQSELVEMSLRLTKVDQELLESKSSCAQLSDKLEAAEKAKVELENEMKMLRVQTEQWRKAADAAALVLSEGVEMKGGRVPERCGSMDKHYGNAFETVSRFSGYVGSPGPVDDSDDLFGSGKRKGSAGGIRNLWKKKGQK